MKRALLMGDYAHHTWHGLAGVDEQIREILSDYEVEICTDYAHLTAERLRPFDFVIDYIDGWNRCGNCDAAGELLSYVAQGGALLACTTASSSAPAPRWSRWSAAPLPATRSTRC